MPANTLTFLHFLSVLGTLLHPPGKPAELKELGAVIYFLLHSFKLCFLLCTFKLRAAPK